MRIEFLKVNTLMEADAAAPWASIIVNVEGGYRAFESMDDYHAWRKQK